MADNTKIEWSQATWNPITGCTKVSPGCDHCYAEREAKGRLKRYYPDGFGKIICHKDRLDIPLRWQRPRMIFVNSMSDLFHDEVPDEFITKVFAVMALTPRHTYQVLTKRHGRMHALVNDDWFKEQIWRDAWELDPRGDIILNTETPWPFPNVWLGVSVEDQKWADIRIPKLLGTPAVVRFLSCEPLLGPIDLEQYLFRFCDREPGTCPRLNGEGPCDGCRVPQHLRGLHWIICGGESGPRARPMHPDWARSIRDECQAAGVPYFFKQWGEWVPVSSDAGVYFSGDIELRADGYSWPIEQPHGADDGTAVTMRRLGKKAAGRQLDGRTWDEMPSGPPRPAPSSATRWSTPHPASTTSACRWSG